MEWKTWQVYSFGKRYVLKLDLNESREGRGRARSSYVCWKCPKYRIVCPSKIVKHFAFLTSIFFYMLPSLSPIRMCFVLHALPPLFNVIFPYYFTPTHKTWPKTFLLHSYGCISNISSLSGIDTMCLKRKKKKKREKKRRSTKGKVNFPLRLDK